MKPTIEGTTFGSITIAGETYRHDVVLRPGGPVERRKKKLSKAVYGTSHTISLAEAEQVYQPGVERLIVGTGQFGRVHLSAEAADFLARRGCAVTLLPTKKAIRAWNEAEGPVVGLFHLTC